MKVSLLEIQAITRGSARVWSDAEVSARGQRRHIGVPVVDHLAGGSTVRQYNRGVAPVALQIERHPEQRRDDLSVETFVVNDLRRRKRGRAQAGNRGKSQLVGMAGAEIGDPKGGGLVWGLVGNEQPNRFPPPRVLLFPQN